MNTSFYYSLNFQSPFFFSMITMILVVPFAPTATATALAQNVRDEEALKAFKSKIVKDPRGVLNSWNDSQHFCEWEGITCGRKHTRVTILDLNSRGLSGSLSPYIGNLSFLRKLTLNNNSIHGEIPHQLGHLFRLETIQLYNNLLVGEIPTNLSNCFRLKVLSIGYNKLVGKIPLEFGSLYNLERLALHNNNLTGGIPPFLGNLTSLKRLSLVDNPLGGEIPNSWDRLINLQYLVLDDNNLFGMVPASLYNLSSISYFGLSGNQLGESLPSDLFLSLPNLEEIYFGRNFFSGPVPVSLSNASKLKTLELGMNNLVGKLSVDFGGTQHLAYLSLSVNHLGSGDVDELNFVNSLVNCSNLRFLDLSRNQLRGVLPHSIANLSTKLQELWLGWNQLCGSISLEIANLVSLDTLVMLDNQFTGPLPKEIGNLHNLQLLSFNDNQLSGEIPSSIGNLSLLVELHLQNNKLTGVIPSGVENLTRLSLLNLSNNDLSGTIPTQIFNIPHLSISLNLAKNQLVGPLPGNIKNLKVLTEFDVSDNYLSGEIPNEIGLYSSLEYLYMKGNYFHGSIPPSLSSLKGIRQLDLSRNNLSGQIPKFLENLLLEKLNLSFNDLEGDVPMKGIFANASAISIVGNNRLCGGVAKLRLPKCPMIGPRKKRLSSVFQILITTANVVLGLTMMSSLVFCWIKKRRVEKVSRNVLEKSLLKVSYQILLKATDGFSQTRLVGVGSFGSVYKGILDQDGATVALKVLNLQNQGAFKSFMAECKALKNIRHRNLVKVITSCSSIDFHGNDFKAIVYEFMENGSLEKWLHPSLETEEEQHGIQSLTILQRISIAIDVASALEYLHCHCEELVLHCDLKPSNVLLDSDMIAHVGDFGLARFLPEVSNLTQSSSVGVKGTIGYVAPEYGLGSEVSTNGDVYSYGILLLEMVTRKRPTDTMFERDFNLHSFARMTLPDRVTDIVDPMLLNEGVTTTNHTTRQTLNNNQKECLTSMVRIGVACSVESPQDRMNISRVVHELQSARKILLQPTLGLNMQRR